MSLESKYGLTKSQIISLHKNGKLVARDFAAEQVLSSYNSKLNSGMSNNEIILAVADEFNYSDSWVRRLLKEAME